MDMKNEIGTSSNTFYINLLKKISPYRGRSPEDDNIYILAFFGMIRSGVPFTITEVPKEKEIQKDCKAGKKSALPASEEDKTDERSMTRMINIVVGSTGYSCEESLLEDRFGKEFENFETLYKEKDISLQEDDFVMPFVRFEEEEQLEDSEKKISKETMPETKKKIPYIKSDAEYPDDPYGLKDYCSFLFNSHDIFIAFENGERKHYTAIVYPLYMDTADALTADILVVMFDESGKIRCGMSDMGNEGQKGVVSTFDECSLIIRGEWREGQFFSKCGIFSTVDGIRASCKEKVTYIKPTKRTSTFYLRCKGNDGTYLNVLPLTLLKNNPNSGLAPVAVIHEDGYSRKLYSGDATTNLSVWFDGSQKQISIYWAGNNLCLEMV